MKTQVVHHNELADLASQTLTALKVSSGKGATVLALVGEVGAGKTTFVQTVAQTLGVTETVTSPTFVVMKLYETNDTHFTRLVHIDAYRIESETEMQPLHFSDLLTDPHTFICIEWPEHLGSLLPDTAVTMKWEVQSDDTRVVTSTHS